MIVDCMTCPARGRRCDTCAVTAMGAAELHLDAAESRAVSMLVGAGNWSIGKSLKVLPVLPEPLEQALALRAGVAGAGLQGGGPRKATTDELLLQLEAAWGLDTPPAFEAARRALKLQGLKAALETRRPASAPATPEQALAELLRRATLDAVQRERLGAALSALRRRGSLAAR